MIDYVSANDGKLELHNNFRGRSIDQTEVFTAGTVQEVANILNTYGFGDSFQSSSSMDFADEYGFETADGAINLLHEGIKFQDNCYVNACGKHWWIEVHYKNGNIGGSRLETFAEYEDFMKNEILRNTKIKSYKVYERENR